jgi:hypothetical protein
MKHTKSSGGSRPRTDATNGSATSTGAWVIEMRPAGSGPPAEEQSPSRTPSSRDLIEQTFRHLRSFLDRMYG